MTPQTVDSDSGLTTRPAAPVDNPQSTPSPHKVHTPQAEQSTLSPPVQNRRQFSPLHPPSIGVESGPTDNTPTTQVEQREPQPEQAGRSADVKRSRAPGFAPRVGMDHCPACRVRRELVEHRDSTAAAWSSRRAAFSFALVLAERACPAYVPPARAEGDS